MLPALSCLEWNGSLGSESCDIVLFIIEGFLVGPASNEFLASSGVRLSRSRLSFSASLRRMRCGFSLQQMIMAFTAIKIARSPVKTDWTAMRTTPVIVWVVCATPSSMTR